MQMPTAIEGESYWKAKIIMPYIYLWGLRDYRTLSSLKQTERKKKACGCNHFQTERLHLERNVGSRKTVEIIFFPPWGTVLCYLSGQRKTALCWWSLAFVKQCASSRARGGLGLLKQVRLLKAIRRLSSLEVFHSCEVLFRGLLLSCSLSVNAGFPVLCKSLPLGSTVLLGHPRFQKEYVIVSGTR